MFLFVFLLYNPLYPVLLLTNVAGVETIYAADLIAALLLVWYARRLAAEIPA